VRKWQKRKDLVSMRADSGKFTVITEPLEAVEAETVSKRKRLVW